MDPASAPGTGQGACPDPPVGTLRAGGQPRAPRGAPRSVEPRSRRSDWRALDTAERTIARPRGGRGALLGRRPGPPPSALSSLHVVRTVQRSHPVTEGDAAALGPQDMVRPLVYHPGLELHGTSDRWPMLHRWTLTIGREARPPEFLQTADAPNLAILRYPSPPRSTLPKVPPLREPFHQVRSRERESPVKLEQAQANARLFRWLAIVGAAPRSRRPLRCPGERRAGQGGV